MSQPRNLNSTAFVLFVIIIWDALKTYLNLQSPIFYAIILVPVVIVGISNNLNNRFWNSLNSRPVSIWLIWILYSFINTFFVEGYAHEIIKQSPLVLISSVIIAFLFMLFIISTGINTWQLIQILIFSYGARLLLSYIFDTGGMFGSTERFGVDFNANTIAFGALFIVVLITIKKIQFSFLGKIDIALLFVSIFTILITGSRKNFLALFILAVGYMYITRSTNVLQNIIKYSLYIFILGGMLFWALNNTAIGNRFIDSYYRTINAKHTNNPEKMFDSRARYYINGWELFKEHPINGVGLRNYQKYDYANKSLHTEYMTQITEGGLIGTLLFIYFYLYIMIKLLQIRRINEYYKKISEIYIVAILIMFVLFFGAWIYRMPMMWVLIALSIRFITEVKEYNSVIKKRELQLNPI